MSEESRIVYFFHGDDEFAISQAVAHVEAQLVEDPSGSLSITRLDGRTKTISDYLGVANAAPFLSRRRIVEITHPLSRVTNPAERKDFLKFLEQLPETTALVLIEPRILVSKPDRRKGKKHWLERWAESRERKACQKEYLLPKGGDLVRWIVARAKSEGVDISLEAAQALAEYSDGDPRLASQELEKLQAYVNYTRTIQKKDVESLTANSNHGNIFAFTDALGKRAQREAVNHLRRLQAYREPKSIFSMIVRHFRMLILTKEMLRQRKSVKEMLSELRVLPFVVDNLIKQQRHFTSPELDALYSRLLELDESIKGGKIEITVAIELFMAEVTQGLIQIRH